MAEKLTDFKIESEKNYTQLVEKYKFDNYDVSFQFYKEKFQEVTLDKLKPKQLKEFNGLMLEILKCRSFDEIKRLHRGKSNPSKNCKLSESKYKEEIIHLGKGHSKFRLHGILFGQIFKVVCIDPDHKVNKSR